MNTLQNAKVPLLCLYCMNTSDLIFDCEWRVDQSTKMCFRECFVNDGANVARLADQPVLLLSYKTLARLSRGKFMSSPNIQSTRMLRRQNY